MPLCNTVVLAALQLFLDIVLLSLLLLIYRRLKALDPKRTGNILDALKEGERLCQVLEKNLEEKTRLVRQLQGCLNAGTEGDSKMEDKASWTDPREKALDLYKKGLDIKDISMRTGLAQGEIEVIISLARSRDRIS